MKFNMNTALQIVYILILLFVLKQVFTMVTKKKSLRDESIIVQFVPKMKMIISFLIIGLFVLGAIFISNKDYFGIVYLLTGAGFGYMFSSKVVIYSSGIYYSGRMDEWSEIKKWSYDYKGSSVKLETTKPGNKGVRIIPVRREDSAQFLKIVKSNKHKKKK